MNEISFNIVRTDGDVALHEVRVNRWLNDGYVIVATGQYFAEGVTTYWTHMVKK